MVCEEKAEKNHQLFSSGMVEGIIVVCMGY
jgi:hypothetical protein